LFLFLFFFVPPTPPPRHKDHRTLLGNPSRHYTLLGPADSAESLCINCEPWVFVED
jgi:hypothetical protein